MADLTNIQHVRVLGWEGDDLHLQRADGSQFKLTNCYPISIEDPSHTNADGSVEVKVTLQFKDE